MDFNECRKNTNQKIISVSENKRNFTIINTKQLRINIIRVDGCLIVDNSTKRCDYLFELEAMNEVLYVELKGKNIVKAYEQLTATIKACSDEHNGLLRKGFIVASRVPRSGPQIQILKKQMSKTLAVQLYVSTNKHTEKIS